jgi:hypothetical protein
MSISERVQKEMVDAMRSKQELRLSTLRMAKAALKNKEIDKRSKLDEKEEIQVLATLINQRKDSIEQFTRGGRLELARKEQQEIEIIEGYLVISEMDSPTMKEMGAVMKNVMARFAGARVDGKLVSETVKRELAGK